MSISDNPLTREMWGTPALTDLRSNDVGRDAYTARTKEQVLAQIHARLVKLPDECWIWTGPRRGNWRGYGSFGWQGRSWSVHRLHWELVKGPIIDPSLQIDHRCHQTLCANLSHLELVTASQNMFRRIPKRRKTPVTHCVHGHEFTPENTIVTAHQRVCRQCDIYRAARHARNNSTTPRQIRGHHMKRSTGLEWHCTCGQWLATGHRGLALEAQREHRATVWAELLANRGEAA